MVAVKFKAEPAHIGLLLPAIIAGIGLTTAVVVAGLLLLHPLTFAVTEYVPEAAVVALIIDGFCKVEAKPFGPVQL